MAPNSSVTVLSSTCTVNPDPGFFISELILNGTDDYTGLQAGSPVVTYKADLVQSSAVFTGLAFCNVTTGPSGSIPCSDGILPAQTVTGLNLSTYSVHLINGSNTVIGGVIQGASIGLTLDFEETRIPTGNTPEPATIGLMSGALLTLVLLARRKKISEARD